MPTDCPQRDERLGWTGDAQMIAETASFNFDVSRFFTKWTHDLADEQHADGAFTDVAPDVCCGAGTAGWGDAGVIVPYALFRRYGDTRVVDRHWTAMTRWIDYLQAHSNGLLRPAQGYGEIRPVPGSGLAEARAAYDSPYGRIGSSWRQTDGRYELNVVVPPNTTATVSVPTDDPAGVSAPPGAQRVGAEDGYAVFAVGSGRYSFRSAAR